MALPPGLEGFETALNSNALRERQQVGALSSLIQAQGALRQQGMDQQFRDEIASAGPDAKPDTLLKIASKYMPPAALGTMLQGAENKKLANETALLRLQQAASQADAKLRFNIASGMDRAAALREHQQEMAAIAAERLRYDTGATVAPRAPAAPSAVAQQFPGMVPQAGLPPALAGRPQNELDAIQAVLSGAGSARTTPNGMEIVRPAGTPWMPPAGPGPVTAPVTPSPAPQAAPVLGAPPVANEDANDRRAAAAARMTQMQPQPTGTVPISSVLTPTEPKPMPPAMPPDIAAAPKRVQDQWRLQQAKQGGATTGNFSLTGEEFLATVPAQDRTFIKKLAAYEIDPKTLSTRGGSREMALKQAAQYDPTFDQKNYNTISQAVNRFATGPQGNTVRSLNVAIEHMDTARKLGTALQNGDTPVFNTIANEFATQTGKPAPTNFNAVKEIVADEVVKGVIGGAGALEDRREAAAKIRAASSPAQLNGVLNSWTELLGGQLKGLEKQYEGATQRKDFRQKYVTPRALQAIEGGSANAYSDADKERRYQEWKARQK